MVGPFIFFDHIGPTTFPAGEGINVRPHPHIGIATITYLFSGEIMHRDSLGYTQAIREGAVNLMTAGRGIVHSERAGNDIGEVAELHGIQSWMVLPTNKEEMDPAFEHVPAGELPELDIDGVKIRVIIGEVFGARSPVTTYSETVYLECRLPEGTSLVVPDSFEQLGAYVVDGCVDVGGESFSRGVLAIAREGHALCIEAKEASHVMILGGAHLGARKIWWNFVSSSAERMEKAKTDWKEGRFDMVPGDDEFIPLPEK